MRTSLKTYEALTEFRSLSLRKAFKPGDKVKAPKTLGSSWVKKGIAKEISTTKQIQQ